MLQRNLLLLFSVILWLLVLYFSLYEDKVAALISYLAVAFTVLTIKFRLSGTESVSESITYFMVILSKIFILAGVFLIMLPQFWNTAFYSACLGIVIQKMVYEIDLKVNSVQVSPEDIASDIHNENKHQTSVYEAPLEQCFQEMEVKESNEEVITYFSEREDPRLFQNLEKYCSNKMKEHEKTVQMEIQSSGESFQNSNVNCIETINFDKEIVIISDKDLQRNLFKETLKYNNLILDELDKQTNYLEQYIAILKEKKISLEAKIESEKKEIERLRDLITQMINHKELALNESSKVELDMANTELKPDAEAKCDVSEHETLNNETSRKDNFSVDDNLQQSSNYSNLIKHTVEDKMTNELSHALTTIYLNRCEDYKSLGDGQKNISAPYERNSCLQSQKVIEEQIYLETVNTSNDDKNLHEFNNDALDFSISSQFQGNFIKINITNTEIEKEKCNLKESLLQQQSLLEANNSVNLKAEYENKRTPAKTVNIKHAKETCENNLISGIVNVNTERVASVPKMDPEIYPEHDNMDESKVLTKSLNVLYPNDSSKINDSPMEKNGTNELEETPREGKECSSRRISDVEGVVNKIDMSFIYSVG